MRIGWEKMPERHAELTGFIRPSSFPQRQFDTHRRPFPQLALPFHLGADFPRSFADADAAEVAGLAVGLGGGVEALAVIGDAEGQDGWNGGVMEC
jgi:hypothetical protein